MDPYKVLGVSPNDSDDKIKQAYRELARKYHPDKYANNPLSDLAQEKMKEINEAYDMITKERASGSSGGGYQNTRGYGSYGSGGYGSRGYSRSSSGYSTGSSEYAEIRMLISMGRLDEAYRALDGMTQRSAEWYYLMGHIYHRRGMYDIARENYLRAYQMEPANPEYKSAVDSMNNAGGMFRTAGGAPGQPCGNCSICDVCAGLMCLDCMCDGC